MMENTPGAMKAGLAFALLGGVFCFFAFAYDISVVDDGSNGMGYVVDALLYILMAALFFALAGGFSRYAQWTQNVLVFMGFLTLGACIAGTVAEYFPVWFGLIGAILAAFCIFASFIGGTARFLALRQAQ